MSFVLNNIGLSATEGATYSFEVTPEPVFLVARTIRWEIIFRGDIPAFSSDFISMSGDLDFVSGATASQTITLSIADDNSYEVDREFVIRVWDTNNTADDISDDTRIGEDAVVILQDDDTNNFTNSVNAFTGLGDNTFTAASSIFLNFVSASGDDSFIITRFQYGDVRINDTAGSSYIKFDRGVTIEAINEEVVSFGGREVTSVDLVLSTGSTITIEAPTKPEFQYQLGDGDLLNYGDFVSTLGTVSASLPYVVTGSSTVATPDDGFRNEIGLYRTVGDDIMGLGSDFDLNITGGLGDDSFIITRFQTGDVRIKDVAGSSYIKFDRGVTIVSVYEEVVSFGGGEVTSVDLILSTGSTINIDAPTKLAFQYQFGDGVLLNYEDFVSALSSVVVSVAGDVSSDRYVVGGIIFGAGPYHYSVSENLDASGVGNAMVLGSISATVTSGETLNYAFDGGTLTDSLGHFAITSVGEISYIGSGLDRETTSVHYLKVQATSSDGSVDVSNISIEVDNVNEIPVLLSMIGSQTVTIAVDLDISSFFGDGDVASSGDELTYTAMRVDSGGVNPTALPSGLSINADTGIFSASSSVVGVTYQVEVTATDSGGLSVVSNVFDLHININTAPVISNAIDDVIYAPLVGGRIIIADSRDITSNVFSDADGDALTYTATLSNGSPLPSGVSLTDVNGVMQLVFSNAVASGVYDFSVMATDIHNLSVTEAFRITVSTAPVVVTGNEISDVTFAFGETGEVVISDSNDTTRNVFSDVDTGDTLTYTLQIEDATGTFVDTFPSGITWDNTMGDEALIFADTVAVGVYDLVIKATDMYGLSVTEAFRITVSTAPVVVTGNEISDVTFAFGETGEVVISDSNDTTRNVFSDVDTGDTLTYTLQIEDATGTFVDTFPSGITWDNTMGDEALIFADTVAVGVYDFIITATDMYGLSVTEAFRITVSTAPVVVTGNEISDVTFAFGETGEVVITDSNDTTRNVFSDVDTGDTLTYTLQIEDATGTFVDTFPSGITWDNTMGDEALIFADTVVVGVYDFIITATDMYGLSVTEAFRITVSTAPVVVTGNEISDVTFAFGETGEVVITDSNDTTRNVFNDADTGDTLTYTLQIEDATGTFVDTFPSGITWDNTMGDEALIFADTVAVGVYDLVIKATDMYGLSVTEAFRVTVSTAPVVVTGNEISDVIFAFGETGEVVITDSNDTTRNVFSDVDTGDTLTYTLQIEDATGTFVDTFPSGITWDNTMGDEALIFANTVAVGVYDLVIKATDMYGLSVTEAFRVTVSTAPVVVTGNEISDVTFAFGETGEVVISDSNDTTRNVFSDVDTGDTLTYTLQIEDATGTFVDTFPSGITWDNTMGDEALIFANTVAVGVYDLVIKATDMYGLSVTEAFRVTVSTAPVVVTGNEISDVTFAFGETGEVVISDSNDTTRNVFSDVDTGDTLTYTLQIEDATGTFVDTFPSGITWDNTMGDEALIFANTVAVGVYDFIITATDMYGLSVTDTFRITVNTAPVVVTGNEISDVTFAFGETGKVVISDSNDTTRNVFNDADTGDTLTYTLQIEDATGTFVDTFPSDITWDNTMSDEALIFADTVAVGVYDFIITATDMYGLSVTEAFRITVSTAPVVVTGNEISDVTFAFGETGEVVISDSNDTTRNVFSDVDTGDTLTYTLQIEDATGTFVDTFPSGITWDNTMGDEALIFADTVAVGVYDFIITATDMYGLSVTEAFRITVSTAPVVVTGNEISDVTFAFGETGEVVISDSNDTTRNVFSDVDTGDTLTYLATFSDGSSLSGGIAFVTSNGVTQLIFANTVAVGVYDLVIKATDMYGLSVTDTLRVTVDTAPVVLNSISDVIIAPRVERRITISDSNDTTRNVFNDADTGDTLIYLATFSDGSSLSGGITFVTSNGVTQLIFANTVAVGVYDFIITATDMYGLSVTEAFRVTVSTTPVVTNSIIDKTFDPLVGGTITISDSSDTIRNVFSDADGDALTYELSIETGNGASTTTLPLGMSLSLDGVTPREIIFSDSVAVGVYDLVIKATDMYGLSVTEAFRVTVSTAPVVVTGNEISDVTFAFGETGEVVIADSNDTTRNVFNDADTGDTLTYTLQIEDATGTFVDTFPSGITWDNTMGDEALIFADTIAVGVYDFIITATDMYGLSVTDTFRITVSTAPVVVTGNEISDVTFAFGETGEVVIADSNDTTRNVFNDADTGDTLTYTLQIEDATGTFVDTFPSGITWDNTMGDEALIFADTVAVGVYDLVIKATDTYGLSVTDTFSVTVDTAPVVLNSISDVIIAPLVGGRITIADSNDTTRNVFSDADGDVLIYLATFSDGSSLSSGITFVTSNGVTQLIFADTVAVGVYDLVIKATDTYGLSVTDTFRITVYTAPVVDEGGDEWLVRRDTETSYSYVIPKNAFSDADGNTPLTYSFNDSDQPFSGAGVTFDASTNRFTLSTNPSVTGYYDVNVTVIYSGSASDNFVLPLHIIDAPALQLTSDLNTTIVKGMKTAGDIIYISTYDADTYSNVSSGVFEAAKSLTYTLGGDDASFFNIDSSTGVVTLINDTNFDDELKSHYAIEITATLVRYSWAFGLSWFDRDYVSSWRIGLDVVETVEDINHPPVIDEGWNEWFIREDAATYFTYTIPENAFKDIDGDSLIYQFDATGDQPFPSADVTFNASTNTFTLSNPSVSIGIHNTNVVRSGYYDMNVRVIDLGGAFTDFVIPLHVIDAFELQLTSDLNTTITEGTKKADTVIYTPTYDENTYSNSFLSYPEIDAAKRLTYSLGGTDASYFNIDSSTGVVTLKNDTKFNYAVKSHYAIEMIATLVRYIWVGGGWGDKDYVSTWRIGLDVEQVEGINYSSVIDKGWDEWFIRQDTATTSFTYTIPENAWIDSEGGALTYLFEATHIAGGSIMTFDASTNTFTLSINPTVYSGYYDLNVRAIDSAGISVDVVIPLHIIDDADLQLTSDLNTTIAEGMKTAGDIIYIPTYDVDTYSNVSSGVFEAAKRLTYSLDTTYGDGSLFEINSISGVVTLKNDIDFNYAVKSHYAIEITATLVRYSWAFGLSWFDWDYVSSWRIGLDVVEAVEPVEGINHPPVVDEGWDEWLIRQDTATSFTYTIPENAFIDPEGGALTYLFDATYIAGGSIMTFDASSNTFTLSTNPSVTGYYDINVRAIDSGGAFTDFVIPLHIIDDAALQLTSDLNTTIAEGMKTASTVIYTPTYDENTYSNSFEGIEATKSLTYSLDTTYGDGSLFEIDASSGIVTLKNNIIFDYSTKSSYDIEITATLVRYSWWYGWTWWDRDYVSSWRIGLDVVETVEGINHSPVIDEGWDEWLIRQDTATSFTYTIPENAFTDIDGDALVYLFDATDDQPFSGAGVAFNASTNTFTLSTNPSVTGYHDLNVKVTDSQGAVVNFVIPLHIIDDGALQLSSDLNTTIAEGMKTAGDIIYIPTYDVDTYSNVSSGVFEAAKRLTYTLGGDDASFFNIDSSTGVVTLINDIDFNYEVKSHYAIEITATLVRYSWWYGLTWFDWDYVSSWRIGLDVVETVGDINHPPVIDEGWDEWLIRQDTATSFTYTIPENAFIDPEGDALTYLFDATYIAGGSIMTFEASTNTFTLSTNPSVTGYHDLNVKVTDSTGAVVNFVIPLHIIDDGALQLTSDLNTTIAEGMKTAGDIIYIPTYDENTYSNSFEGIEATKSLTYSLDTTYGDGSLFEIDASSGIVTLINDIDFNYEVKSHYAIEITATLVRYSWAFGLSWFDTDYVSTWRIGLDVVEAVEPVEGINHPPVIDEGWDEWLIRQDTATSFTYTIPENAFIDPEGDALTYLFDATYIAGGSIMTFDASSNTFTLSTNPSVTGYYDINVRAIDSGGAFTDFVIPLHIIDDAALQLTSDLNTTIAEGMKTAGTIIYTPTYDENTYSNSFEGIEATKSLTYSLDTTYGDGSLFEIDASSGIVTLKNNIIFDYEIESHYAIEITATLVRYSWAFGLSWFDTDYVSSWRIGLDVVEGVEGINYSSVIDGGWDEWLIRQDTATYFTYTIPENAWIDSEGDALTYLFDATYIAGGSIMTFDASTNTFTLSTNPSVTGYYDINVRAIDSGGAFTDFVIPLHIIDDAALQLTSDLNTTIAEGMKTAGTVIYTPTYDENTYSNSFEGIEVAKSLTYSLDTTYGDGSLFEIDASSGIVTLKNNIIFDYEIKSHYAIAITATLSRTTWVGWWTYDDIDYASTWRIGLDIEQVEGINHFPVIDEGWDEWLIRKGTTATSFTYTIPENAFTDIDGDALVYLFDATDDQPFSGAGVAFNASTNTFTMSNPTVYGGYYSINVKVTDSQGASVDFVIPIHIINEYCLVLTSDSSITIVKGMKTAGDTIYTPMYDENTKNNSSYETVEPAKSLTYTLGGTDASLFNIDSSTGVVTLINDTNFNYEVKSHYAIEITATLVRLNYISAGSWYTKNYVSTWRVRIDVEQTIGVSIDENIANSDGFTGTFSEKARSITFGNYYTDVYKKGVFVLYNSLDDTGATYIESAVVIFKKNMRAVYRATLSFTDDIIIVRAPENIEFDEVVLVHATDNQDYRGFDIFGVEVDAHLSEDITNRGSEHYGQAIDGDIGSSFGGGLTQYIYFGNYGIDYFKNGLFTLYNTTDEATKNDIVGTQIFFKLHMQQVYSETINSSDSVIKIKPPKNVVFDEVIIQYQNDTQYHYGYEIFGIEVADITPVGYGQAVTGSVADLGHYITFANYGIDYYKNGVFVLYNSRGDPTRYEIVGSDVLFKNNLGIVYSYTITRSDVNDAILGILSIAPPADTKFDEVTLYYSGTTQHHYGYDIFGERVDTIIEITPAGYGQAVTGVLGGLVQDITFDNDGIDSYKNGSFTLYNSTDEATKDYIVGSRIVFQKNMLEMYAQVIDSPDDIVTIIVPSDIEFDEVVIEYSGLTQNHRGFVISGTKIEDVATTIPETYFSENITLSGNGQAVTGVLGGLVQYIYFGNHATDNYKNGSFVLYNSTEEATKNYIVDSRIIFKKNLEEIYVYTISSSDVDNAPNGVLLVRPSSGIKFDEIVIVYSGLTQNHRGYDIFGTKIETISVREDIEAGSVIYTYDAHADGHSYTLEGSDVSDFTVSDRGIISFDNSPDYETQNSHDISLIIEDTLGYRSEVEINVDVELVEGINHAPVIDGGWDEWLIRKDTATYFTYTIPDDAFRDPDGDALTYLFDYLDQPIDSADNYVASNLYGENSFTISNPTVTGYYDLNVTVEDSQGASVDFEIPIHII